MLFQKRPPRPVRVTHELRSRKEELKDASGRTLVIVNLIYPSLSGKTPLASRFNDFYQKTADAYYAFAEDDLRTIAEKNPDRPPCGAVLKAAVTAEDDETLTVTLDASVYDGQSRLTPFHDERRWDKRTGLF